mmetsp:Transcript_33661/g.86247  ORF Transcript_33661/g.86247 Transcript_33661/m.86247 type:complete len:866 (-) Transcript_33661:2775-5372(-)
MEREGEGKGEETRGERQIERRGEEEGRESRKHEEKEVKNEEKSEGSGDISGGTKQGALTTSDMEASPSSIETERREKMEEEEMQGVNGEVKVANAVRKREEEEEDPVAEALALVRAEKSGFAFDPVVFDLPHFDYVKFVRDQRKRVHLPELESDLSRYLDKVNGDIVDAIQQNFDFLSRMSTSLDSVTELEESAAPYLAKLGALAGDTKKTLKDEADKVDELLNSMMALKEERAALDRIMRAEDALSKVQRLLHREETRGESAERKHVRLERIAMEFGSAEHLLVDGTKVDTSVRLGDQTRRVVQKLQSSVIELEKTIVAAVEKALIKVVSADDVMGEEFACLIRSFGHIGKTDAAETVLRDSYFGRQVDKVVAKVQSKEGMTVDEKESLLLEYLLELADTSVGGVMQTCIEQGVITASSAGVHANGSGTNMGSSGQRGREVESDSERGRVDEKSRSVSGRGIAAEIDIVSNSFFPAVVDALIVYDAGRLFGFDQPKRIHQHVAMISKFVSQLEKVLKLQGRALSLFRASRGYTTLFEKLALPTKAFFQLESRSFISRVEQLLSATVEVKSEPTLFIVSKRSSTSLFCSNIYHVLEEVRQFFSRSSYLDVVGGKFVQVALQSMLTISHFCHAYAQSEMEGKEKGGGKEDMKRGMGIAHDVHSCASILSHLLFACLDANDVCVQKERLLPGFAAVSDEMKKGASAVFDQVQNKFCTTSMEYLKAIKNVPMRLRRGGAGGGGGGEGPSRWVGAVVQSAKDVMEPARERKVEEDVANAMARALKAIVAEFVVYSKEAMESIQKTDKSLARLQRKGTDNGNGGDTEGVGKAKILFLTDMHELRQGLISVHPLLDPSSDEIWTKFEEYLR